MKRTTYYLLTFISLCIIAINFISCDDDRQNLDLAGEVKILSFSANGTEATIDESAQQGVITLMLPRTTDLTKVTPQIKLSAGATVTPDGNSEMDLSKPTKFTVVNGSLYHDYTVVAAHIIGKILTFDIGKYKGVIDHESGTIHVRYPKTQDVTKLIPTLTVTSGATVTPNPGTAVDFSQPVKYTVNYMGETFDYVVTIEKADIKPIAYLGVALKAESIENEDEKAAFEWLNATMPDVQYISFSDIKNGSVNLQEYAVMWWHTDGSTRALPDVALDEIVITSLKNYYNGGGSFFFSSWAVKYAATLGIPKDGKPVNNEWGEANAADAVELGENWGLYFTGNESHPVFKNLNLPVGVNNKVFLLSKGLKVKGHNAVWNFAEDWVQYKDDMAGWSRDTGAKSLASFHWDDSAKSRSVMFEYPKAGSHGGVICIGSEAYDWSVQGTNSFIGNIEQLTVNTFNYLSN